MSEEKEAIKEIKNKFEYLKNSSIPDYNLIFAIEKVLNLIDKLQKENEELKDNKEIYEETINDYESEAKRDKEEIDKLQNENSNLKKEIKLMKSVNINENYISKDKIKELKEKEISRIQILGELLNTNDILNSYTRKYTDIDMIENAGMEINRVLQELLGDDNID